jgi:hypothetical protein
MSKIFKNPFRKAATAINNIAAAKVAANAATVTVNSTVNAATKVAPFQHYKISIIVVLVIFGIMAILGFVTFIIQQVKNGEISAIEQQVQTSNTQNTEKLNKLNSANQIQSTNMKRGDQGPPGIQGPPGPTGGVHAGAGPLLCVGQKKVATPTVGTSQYSIIYLDDRRYTPIQYWTMRNNTDGTVSVVNKFTGNCMTTNNLGDVFSDTCKTPTPLTQKFNWGPNMQLSSADKQNFCVTVDQLSLNTSNSNNKFDLNNMTEKKDSNNGTVTQLKLRACSQSQNLDQTWWVGN